MNPFLLVFIIAVAIAVVYANIVLIKLIKRVKEDENNFAVFKFEQEHGKNKTHWEFTYCYFNERVVFTYVRKNTLYTTYLDHISRQCYDIEIVDDNCCWAIIKLKYDDRKPDWCKLDKTENTTTWIPEPAQYAEKNEVTE